MKETQPIPADIIELTPLRAHLVRGRRTRSLDVIMDAKDPRPAIQALPGDEFFYLVQQTGLEESFDLIRHATPEQIQTAFDLAIWDRDTVSLESADAWLDVMVQAPQESVGAWFRGLDIELCALLLRKHAILYTLSDGEPPDDPQGIFYSTPDNLFAMDVFGTDDQIRITLRLIEALYNTNRHWARRVILGCQGELDSELEEMAYRWRSGRLADLGFSDYYEALEIYRPLDATAVRPGAKPNARVRPTSGPSEGEGMRLPGALVESLSTGGRPFANAVAGLTSRDEVDDLHFALVALSNQVLAADRVSPGDEPRVDQVLGRMLATLDLAMEFLSRGQGEESVRCLRTIALGRIFRLGVTLLGKVSTLGQTLRRTSPFARLRPDLDLFTSEDLAVLSAVTALRPQFPRILDAPPGSGLRPFASLADIAKATAAVERAGAAIALLNAMGVRPEHLLPDALPGLGVKDPTGLDAAILGRTALAWIAMGQPPGPPRALDKADANKLKSIRDKCSQNTDTIEELRLLIAPFLVACTEGSQAPLGAISAIAEGWLTDLLDGDSVLRRTRD